MGWGDEIMLTGDARRRQRQDPRPIVVHDKRGQPRWHPIWDDNPRLVKPHQAREGDLRVQRMDNGPGKRPYLEYAGLTDNRYLFRDDYSPEPGEIYLTPDEKKFGERAVDCIIVAPHVKSWRQCNKDWGWGRWVTLLGLLPKLPWIQIGDGTQPVLPGARQLRTQTVRFAAAAVSHARAFVSAEGGLHHCAAAFARPGVVIFGGFISPKVTGYACHHNLAVPSEAYPLGCGMRVPCEHCQAAMKVITPEKVAAELLQILEAKRAA